ncbi:MAG TPA: YciI family protein [Chthoniobacterales bacterium]
MATNPVPPTDAFMLLFRNAGPETHQHLSPEQRAELAKQWNDWYDELAARGKVQHGRPLGLQGRLVSGTRGQTVIDGPYAEAKEVVGGYLFLSVTDFDEATEIAKMCPGLPLGLTVEVRPVVAFSPVLEDVRAHSPEPPNAV